MLYIDKTTTADGTLLNVTGELFGAGVEEFERVCRLSTKPLLLDLSDLREVDLSGLLAIQRQKQQGASLIKVSLYLELLLEPEQSENASMIRLARRLRAQCGVQGSYSDCPKGV